MTRLLENKNALITGASRGIGRAAALRLADLGASIVLNYVRNDEAARQTAEEIKSRGVRVTLFQANVGEASETAALVKHGLAELGGVDILVHCAAMGAFKPVHKLRENQWDLSMDINAKAFLLLAQGTAESMASRGGGSMIALSSLGSQQFIPNYGAIGISKAALEALVRSLAVELASKKIRVNAVSGGLVNTDAIQFFPEHEQFLKQVVERTPAGRVAEPDDLARVVAFLASPDSAWITGQTLIADGGLSLL
jgi:enoyl-[acyl-carrier protein] reductase III